MMLDGRTLETQWWGPGPESAATLVLLQAVVLAGYAGGWRGWSRGFWPPFAVVALGLAVGVKFG